MRRLILIILLAVSLAITGCAPLRRVLKGPQAPTPALSVAEGPTPVSAVPPQTEVPAAAPTLPPTVAPTSVPTPDFAAMTFAEKNDLFLELLAARQAEGADTSAAEDAYVRSLEATLEGNTTLADQYLIEAILLLWR